MMISHTRVAWMFTGSLLVSLLACPISSAVDLQSVIFPGMSYRLVAPLIEEAGLRCFVLLLPKDPGNWKRYQFSKAYSLLMVSKWSSVGHNSGLRHLTVDEIWLVPNKRLEGVPSWPLKADVVDLKTRNFRTQGIYPNIRIKMEAEK